MSKREWEEHTEVTTRRADRALLLLYTQHSSRRVSQQYKIGFELRTPLTQSSLSTLQRLPNWLPWSQAVWLSGASIAAVTSPVLLSLNQLDLSRCISLDW